MSAAETKPALMLDPRTYRRGLSCVHCGLCLPACPTYTETGNEADSPRGRIQLMLGLADAKIEATESVKHHLDLCLDCRACETACPSGVVYHELIEETRATLLSQEKLTLQGRFMRWMFFHVFVYPTRLKLALLRKIGLFKLLPVQLRKMEQMLPESGSVWASRLPEHVGPRAKPQAERRVAFLAGCIGSVMFEKVNRQAVDLLSACGGDVVIPRAQNCCGAIHHHNGAHDQAEEFARKNIDAIIPENQPAPDYIATCIAGCGAMLRDYNFLLRDDPKYAERAKIFAAKVRDISEVLLELGLPQELGPIDATITYHDACHLAHAQKVTAAPRALLAKIPGLKIVPLPESDMCCGAAGTYNLTQPEMAMALAERKIANIQLTGARICVTGNVGCAMQIQSEALARGRHIEVVHPVELLHQAVFAHEQH
jgi:glycolate oxidase iron-sulfur subunit